VTIWFHHLACDWFALRKPELKSIPFVVAAMDHGRKIIVAANSLSVQQGIYIGMPVADAKAMVPSLEVLDDRPGLAEKLLNGIAEWCIRYTPAVSIDLPGGLILDVTGCAHLCLTASPDDILQLTLSRADEKSIPTEVDKRKQLKEKEKKVFYGGRNFR